MIGASVENCIGQRAVISPRESPVLEQVREDALISRSRRGDSAAFAALYEEHVVRVYRHVYYFVGSKTEAEDLTAQTFLQAWSAIGRYQDCGKPILPWLLAIAHNLVVSRFRNSHCEGRLHEGIAVYEHSISPEEVCIANLQRQEIVEAILKLKPLERQVILFRFVDNMDYAEVERVLNKSVNAVRVIQYRALRNLRQIIEDHTGTGGRGSTWV